MLLKDILLPHSFSPTSFSDITKEIGEAHFVYFQNPGNYGDSLIRQGAEELWKYHSLSYSRITHHNYTEKIEQVKKEHPTCTTFVYSGSGAWIHPYFKRTTEIIEYAFTHFEKIIILPSTFFPHPELTAFLKKNKDKNIIFFRRDDGISKQALPEAKLAPDTALFIHTFTPTKILPSQRIGYFFRTDIEATKKRNIPITNLDLSLLGDETTDVSLFFQTLAQYEEIHTDRLHVGIAGFLLGKNVFLYDNIYGKNKSFYETFFKDTSHVTFIP